MLMDTFTNLQVLELRSNQFTSLKVEFFVKLYQILNMSLGPGTAKITEKIIRCPESNQWLDALV